MFFPSELICIVGAVVAGVLSYNQDMCKIEEKINNPMLNILWISILEQWLCCTAAGVSPINLKKKIKKNNEKYKKK